MSYYLYKKYKMSCDKLFFFSKSYDYFPGKGANEYVEDSDSYKELSKIKNWRKMLSNFHEYQFEYDGKKYNSIEHAFQGTKFSIFNEEIGKLFEVGNEIGELYSLEARKNRKKIVLDYDQLYMWNIMSADIMYEISLEKYKQCLESKNMLKMTNNAELWHIQLRNIPIRFIHLEKIRDLICN